MKAITFLVVLFFMADISSATSRSVPDMPENDSDSARNVTFSPGKRFVHRLGIDIRPEYIIPANPFLKGENEKLQPIRNSFSTHLKYSFQPHHNTDMDRIFGGAYQGIGLAYYTFGEKKCLGDPVALYLFQGARLANLDSRISFNYEWNFGLSAGWMPHDYETNYYNTIIGSKINAYINTNFYINWMLSRKLDLTTGITLTHFSNGNTRFPNAGLNSVGLNTGLVYNFNRKNQSLSDASFRTSISEFPRHISYDLMLFGSWRRKGIVSGEERIPSPHTYSVMGFNFAPMYNTSYKFRVGVSIDGYYDNSINIYIPEDYAGSDPPFMKPPLKEQLVLGISARTEYVMPYFSVNMGIGYNIIHQEKGKIIYPDYNIHSNKTNDFIQPYAEDKKSLYQILALKIKVTRNSFIHIGYSLQNFDTPNFLMLGVGLRFNNKYPSLRH